MPVETETAIDILECAKKSGDRDYLAEYEVTIDKVRKQLLEAGFPTDQPDDLNKYSIDVCALSVFQHRLGLHDKSVSIGECFALFMGQSGDDHVVGKGKITDLAWNQTLERIVEQLEEIGT